MIRNKIKKYFFYFIIPLVLGCSKTEPSTAIAETIKQDVKVIKKSIATTEEILAVECKTPAVISQLDTLKEQVLTISTKADSVDLACKAEKEVYTQQISKLRVIIFGLIIACGLLGFVIIKRKTL